MLEDNARTDKMAAEYQADMQASMDSINNSEDEDPFKQGTATTMSEFMTKTGSLTINLHKYHNSMFSYYGDALGCALANNVYLHQELGNLESELFDVKGMVQSLSKQISF